MKWDYDRVQLTWFLELVDVFLKKKSQKFEKIYTFEKAEQKATKQHRVEEWSGLFVRNKTSQNHRKCFWHVMESAEHTHMWGCINNSNGSATACI